jgi:hypothetical protein
MTGRRYAEGTEVTSDRSRLELERLLTAHGATGFVSGWDASTAEHRIIFRVADRMIRLSVPLVDPDADEFRLTPSGKWERTAKQSKDAATAEQRRRWRALVLVVKAKLVAVADGVQTLEEAFLADVLLPDQRTVGEWLAPQLDTAYATAEMPSLLPGCGRRALPAEVTRDP